MTLAARSQSRRVRARADTATPKCRRNSRATFVSSTGASRRWAKLMTAPAVYPSYPRQPAKVLHGRRKDATTLGDAQRSSMQPAAPDLVTQRIGDRLHVCQRRLGHRVNGWIPPEEAGIHWQHPSDLGLVREHFGNQDGVGVTGLSPGQIASVDRIPGQHPALEGSAAAGADCWKHRVGGGLPEA